MSFLLNAILSLAFAAAIAGAVHVWRRQMAGARRDDLRALAARRGWSLTEAQEALGRARTLRLAPRGGHPWVAESRPDPQEPSLGRTVYEAEEPRWAGGTLVAAAVAPTSPGLALPSADDGQLLRRLLGAQAARLPALGPVVAPEGLVVLADAEPAPRVDLQDLARVLAGWRPLAPGDRGAAVLELSPEGMRLTLRHPVARADRMERFIDLAFELSRIIGP